MNYDFAYELGGRPQQYRFVYNPTDRAVSSKWIEPFSEIGRTGRSICIADLNLEIAEDNSVIDAWGYFPAEAWLFDAMLRLPKADAGRVFLTNSSALTPGVSLRVPGSEAWKSYLIEGVGWALLCPEPRSKSEIAVQVAEGLICSLTCGRIVGLWLLGETEQRGKESCC